MSKLLKRLSNLSKSSRSSKASATSDSNNTSATPAPAPASSSSTPAPQPTTEAIPATTTEATPTTTATKMSSAKIAVIIYSTYGHIAALAEKIVEGVKSTGVTVDVYQIPETLSEEVLAKFHANKAATKDFPEITPSKLEEYDGFIFGFPTRFGRAPAQVSAFFDQTGGLWAKGGLIGKFAATFTSTGSQHGGQETTHLTTIPFFAHHGIIYVPSSFKFPELTSYDAIIGSSAYGAGALAGSDGSRQATTQDLAVAKGQGEHFASIVNTFVKGKSA